MATTSSKTKRIVLVSTDKTFVQDTKAAFASSDLIQLSTVEKSVVELRGEIQEADCDAVIIDMDAAKLEEIEALQRITRRLEGKGADPRRDAGIQRGRRAHPGAAAGRRLPGQAADHRRPGALLHPRAAGAGPRGQHGIADLHLHAGGRWRRLHDAYLADGIPVASFGDARGVDLRRRPQLPAGRLRRISRPRTALRHHRNREPAGASRPPAARRDAVQAFERSVRAGRA